MSSSAQLALLRAAIALVGSNATLASKLRVTDLDLREWASGDVSIPERVIPELIDVIHEATSRDQRFPDAP